MRRGVSVVDMVGAIGSSAERLESHRDGDFGVNRDGELRSLDTPLQRDESWVRPVDEP